LIDGFCAPFVQLAAVCLLFILVGIGPLNTAFDAIPCFFICFEFDGDFGAHSEGPKVNQFIKLDAFLFVFLLFLLLGCGMLPVLVRIGELNTAFNHFFHSLRNWVIAWFACLIEWISVSIPKGIPKPIQSRKVPAFGLLCELVPLA
jgi:hypothetical protein